ncbi:MAG: S41 family peptidase [Bacteroidales bacterium]|nr:S41 family peptidase [Bacteroidales bacterium]
MHTIRKSLILLLLLPSLAFAQSTYDKGFEIAKNLEIFANVYRNIHLNYVDDLDPGKTMKTAIDAMLASLDPYTNYYPESDIEDVKLQLLGEYGGIGALIHQKDKNIYIAEPYEGMPADEAGLKAGDRIVEVNGVSTEGKNNGDVSAAMRGQAGTTVTLKLERQGKIFEKKLTRREIKLKTVPYYGFVQNDVGYIKLNEYTQGSAKQVRDAFHALKEERPQMKGIILDLRGNGGGLLNEAVDIVNIFVQKGELIVETKGKVASKNLKSFTRMAPEDTEMPMAVLIDGYSASASEITSGSLQDLDRAIIVGTRSFGKGLVQNVLPMNYNTQMKVTVSKYFIPSGRCIQAIDYAKRDANGKAVKVPDSLKTAFKTRNGRTVYDGFGIEPDVEVTPEYMSSLSLALINKFLIFDFATEFVQTHPSILPAAEFEITDDIYNDFKQFLSTKDYSYNTITENILKDLRESAKEEEYLESIQKELDELEAKFKADKQGDLDKHRAEIAEMLKAEILGRYYYEKGRIEGSLKSDPDVLKAVELLCDKAAYKKLLTK